MILRSLAYLVCSREGRCRQQSKLTASRQLRVRKIAFHVRGSLVLAIPSSLFNLTLHTKQVQEKLDKMVSSSGATSLRSSVDENGGGSAHGSHSRNNSSPTKTRNNSPGAHSHHRPEPEYEILCNDTPLPLNMTLAAVRQYVWKQSSELAMHYRKRAAVPAGGEGDLSR